MLASKVDPDLAKAFRERIEAAGWVVSDLLQIIAPYDDEDTEAIFRGHPAKGRVHLKQRHQPHTAFVPQDPKGEVIVVDGLL